MKIALVNTMGPFLRGGAELLVDDLYDQLLKRGHQVVLFRLPFPSDFEVALLRTVLASKLLNFSSYDRVIAFKFPAYCVFHRHKTLWLFHQFRQVYDLYGKQDGLSESATAFALKQVITELDCIEIGEAKHVFVNAKEVANRLMRYNSIPSKVLPPPLQDAEQYHSGDFGDYFYYPSRVTSLKRQHLAIEAMKYVKTDVKLVIAGCCTEPDYEEKLRTLIRTYNLEAKVSYENCWVENDKKIEMLANSLGVIYIPYLEDSWGFVTDEGFYSAKPVISCLDSGGTKEYIEDGRNGFLVEPEARAIAEKMDLLYQDRSLARRMGNEALNDIVKANLTWDETVRSLLQ